MCQNIIPPDRIVIGGVFMLISQGAKIGQFELIALLGEGSFAEVWEATDTTLGRNVAIKFPKVKDKANQSACFLFEGRNVASMKHPGIVELFEISNDPDFPFLVLELVDGVTLREWCRFTESGFKAIADLISQSAQAIHYAHQHGLVHQDLKPENILVELEGRVKITDFGLSVSSMDIKDGDEIAGTPVYMSPEQAIGDVHSPISDVFSLGVILFELLTNELPFIGSSKTEYIASLTKSRAVRCKDRNPRVPRALASICDKCLAHDRKNRFQSAIELADELDRFVNGQIVLVERWNLTHVSMTTWKKYRFAIFPVLGISTVLFVTLAALIVRNARVNRQARTNRLELLAKSFFHGTAQEAVLLYHEVVKEPDLQTDKSEEPVLYCRNLMVKLGRGENCSSAFFERLSEYPDAEGSGIVQSIRMPLAIKECRKCLESLLELERDSDLEKKLRRLILLAHLQGPEVLQPLSRHKEDPTLRTALIECIARFNGGFHEIVSLLSRTQDADLQYVLLLAVGLAAEQHREVDRGELATSIRRIRLEAGDSGVKSAYDWAMKRLKVPSEQLVELVSANGCTQRIVGLDFIAVETFEDQRTNESRQTFFISRSEVPSWLFVEFAASVDGPESRNWAGVSYDSPESPARFFPLWDVPRFCNWLSVRCNRSPAYLLGGSVNFGNNENWEVNLKCNGVRLPSENEWENAARDRCNTKYFWGSTVEHVELFASASPHFKSNRIANIETSMPNRRGFFDILGSVEECCHTIDGKLSRRGGHAFMLKDSCSWQKRSIVDYYRPVPSTGLRLVVLDP